MDEPTLEPTAKADTRFSRRREKTRKELLFAARKVFGRKGLADTTIKEITDEADVGFGTFYLHFASKEEIFQEVLRQGLDELSTAVYDAGANAPTPIAGYQASILVYFKLAYTNRDLFQLIFSAQGEAIEEIRRIRAQTRERLAGRLEVLIQSGLVKSSEPELLASLVFGVMIQAGLWWVDHTTPSPEEMAQIVSDFLMKAILGNLPTELTTLLREQTLKRE
jgi:AcrR family transcriptional regulator